MKNRNICSLAAIAVMTLLAAEDAASADNDFEAEISVGVEYDDNITIDSIDNNSAKGDSLLRINGAIGGQLFESGDTSLSARYSFFQSLHQDLTDFDLQIHGFSGRLKTKAGKLNLGADYRYDYIRLAGADFLNVHTIGPDVGLLVAKNTYLTVGYQFRTQSFSDPARSERDADRHSLDGKLYFLMGKGRNVTIGYRASRQLATDDSFSYWGHRFDTGVKLPVELAEAKATFRLRYRYQQKDYSATDLRIGDRRHDKRHTARASLEIPFGKNLQADLEYRFVASNSNLAIVDYTSNSIRAGLGWTF